MTARHPMPHDDQLERFLLGACLIRRDALNAIANQIDPTDFYRPSHQVTFHAMLALWREGIPLDAFTVADKAGGQGLPMVELAAAQGEAPSTHVESYAAAVVALSSRRQIITLAHDLHQAAQTDRDPGDLLDEARAALESVTLPGAALPDDLHRLADLMNRPEEERSPWVVPGLLRQDWRVVVVAPEGAGKSLVLQQVGICAAQGVHPFGFEETPPARVLFVDLENPEERIVHGAKMIDPHVRRLARAHDDDRVWIWNRQGGINLRSRADRATLEAVLAHLRPQLVCMGPAYKASVKERGEGWDESALATQRTLDQLRTRYGFALLMEDHAPQSAGGVRDLRPFGSSVWLRWPEIGLKLAPDQPNRPNKLELSRWRGDRLPNEWPDELHRGNQGEFPWQGFWPNGRRNAA